MHFKLYIYIRNNDLIIHKAMRSESPVGDFKIDIIFENESLLVVNKPPSIPVYI